MEKETLASALRNQLTPLWTLITFLEEEPANKEWEQRFRESALDTLPKIETLLNEFLIKEE